MLDVLGDEFVRTARAKGVTEIRVIVRHAFSNTPLPIVTVLGVQIGNLLAGAVVTEAVFAWPGLGSLTVEAIYRRDYPLVQAVILFFAFAYAGLNMLVECSTPTSIPGPARHDPSPAAGVGAGVALRRSPDRHRGGGRDGVAARARRL